MPKFLLIHSPIDEGEDAAVRAPSRLLDLARDHGGEDGSPRWLTTYSPDLEDDRIFSLWDARSASEITDVLTRYGFLDHMSTQALRVQEWGPASVLAAEDTPK